MAKQAASLFDRHNKKFVLDVHAYMTLGPNRHLAEASGPSHVPWAGSRGGANRGRRYVCLMQCGQLSAARYAQAQSAGPFVLGHAAV